MPAVAKRMAKTSASKLADGVKKPKKQSLKKVQKTAEIKVAKKLAKLKSSKAVSDKFNRAPLVKKQKSKHGFDATRLNRGVMLIQNLPKGFFEDQLKQYFSQYGQVTRYRAVRSEKTGGSEGFAYVEFKYPEVAKVAAESMNGYLIFRQRLKTVYIPPDKQDHDYFIQPVKLLKTKDGLTKLVSPATIRAEKAVENFNKPVTPEAHTNRVERSKYKLKLLEKKLAKAGITIDLSEQMYSSESKDAKNSAKSKKDKNNKEKPKLKKSVVDDKVSTDSVISTAKKAKLQPKLETVKGKVDKTKLKKAESKSKLASEEPIVPAKKKAKKEIISEKVKPKKEKLKQKKVVASDEAPVAAPIALKKKKVKSELKSETVIAKKVKPTVKKANEPLTSVKVGSVSKKKTKEEPPSKKVKSKKTKPSKIY